MLRQCKRAIPPATATKRIHERDRINVDGIVGIAFLRHISRRHITYTYNTSSSIMAVCLKCKPYVLWQIRWWYWVLERLPTYITSTCTLCIIGFHGKCINVTFLLCSLAVKTAPQMEGQGINNTTHSLALFYVPIIESKPVFTGPNGHRLELWHHQARAEDRLNSRPRQVLARISAGLNSLYIHPVVKRSKEAVH